MAEIRSESPWAQIRAEAEASRAAGRSVNSVLQLAELVQAGSVRSTIVAGEILPGYVGVGFFQVSATHPDGRELLTADELLEALEGAVDQASGDFGTVIDRHRFLEGPSYIELGSWLGDQGIAIALIGLGALFGFWTVASPETLGITGAEADQMRGMGFLFPSLTADSPLAAWKEASA